MVSVERHWTLDGQLCSTAWAIPTRLLLDKDLVVKKRCSATHHLIRTPQPLGKLRDVSLMESIMNTVYTEMPSPLGAVTIQSNAEGLLGIWFETCTTKPSELGRRDDQHPILRQAVTQLDEYFSGLRNEFDLPLAATGTDFQNQVWHALTTIPYGETWSYQDLANAIGNPKAVRAVGLANGKNPISIVVPCHRVIGKSGKLTGYAGGVERKQRLLALEQGTPL